MLVMELGTLDVTEVTLTILKEYLAKQAGRLKPTSLGHRIRFLRSLSRNAYEETYLTSNPSLKLREPKLDKRIPKFLIEEDVIHLKISFSHSGKEHCLSSSAAPAAGLGR